jgi:cytochrome c oxidase subunit 2
MIFLNFLSQKFSTLFQNLSLKTKIHKFTHQTSLETIWTITPVFFIFLFGIPSFVLLYSNDVPVDSSVILKAVGKQWFWNYQLQCPVLDENGLVDYKQYSFDSYMVNANDLFKGQLRNLEVDQAVRLPGKTHVDIIVTADDVLHSFALPSLGIKVDAVPGRLNHTGVFIERPGVFYGQCSELCGTNHAFMPIKLFSLPYDLYVSSFPSTLRF